MSYNNFDKIEYEGTNYYPRDTRTNLVIGTHTGSTNTWTGALPEGVNSYTDPENLIIDYFLPYDGTSAEATLNLSSLGAKPIYASHGISPITDEFKAKSIIRLAYIIDSSFNDGNGAWKVIGSDASGKGGAIDVTKETINTIATNSWNAGTLPTLNTLEQSVVDITAYNPGAQTYFEVHNGILQLRIGHPTEIAYSQKNINTVTQFDSGTSPSLTVENKTVVTNVSIVDEN